MIVADGFNSDRHFGVGDMGAVPREEKVHPVDRSYCNVGGIGGGVGG